MEIVGGLECFDQAPTSKTISLAIFQKGIRKLSQCVILDSQGNLGVLGPRCQKEKTSTTS